MHRMMFDVESGSAGTMCCGAVFVWSYQTVGGRMNFNCLVVEHADDAMLTCMGCIANDLG